MAQWNKNTQDFGPNNSSLFEVNQLARKDGSVVGENNHLYVGAYTPKNRLKVSDEQISFYNTFQFNSAPDIWEEETANGGSSAYDANVNNVDMICSGTAGESVIRQTKRVMDYVPGRQSAATVAFRGGVADNGYRKRVGLFDENNGIFLEMHGDNNYFVIRSNTSGTPVERKVEQANWNVDKLDGTGLSGFDLDLSKQHLVTFDYEWYGAGNVDCFFSLGGVLILAHRFTNSNELDVPWMTTPFLPFRLEIVQTGTIDVAGSNYLYHGSTSQTTEGNVAYIGEPGTIVSPETNTGAASTWVPILSVRLANLKAIVKLQSLSVATIDNTNVFFKLVKGIDPADLTGGSAFQLANPQSTIEYQTYTTPAAIAVVDHGEPLTTGFVTTGAGDKGLTGDSLYQIGRSGITAPTSEVYTILVSSTGGNKSALAALNWSEVR